MPSPRTPGPTKEEIVKDFRTTEILDAARQVIADQGIAEASMERIAQAAGIAKGTIYLYFKNKEELILRAVRHGFEELMNRTRGAAGRVHGTRAKLEQVVRSALAHTAEQQSFFEALAERASLGTDGASALTEQMFELEELYVGFISELIAEGQAKSELRDYPTGLAARLMADCVRGAVVTHVRGGESRDPDADAHAIVDFFFHGVGTDARSKGTP